ncbi:MAG: class I SAM-dependent methyltransferase, partial [Myxococcaceae bacterium]
GRRLCQADGTLAKLPAIVAAREESSKAFFDQPAASAAPLTGDFAAPAYLAHLAAFAPMLPGRGLAIDAGTGEGLLLDVLAPLYARVIAVDRSQAQLARCAARIAARGFHQVSLFPGSYDDVALVERVDNAGGADLVFSARALHHVARPAQAVAAFVRLLKRGGHLVLLEYQPHEDDSMRGAQGDVWLGFTAKELSAHCEAAGLQIVGEVSIPSAYHREGSDAHLAWHSVVARKPPKEKSV